MVPYTVALDLPHALVEWVTMLIVIRKGDRRCKLPPRRRALVALVYLRRHDPLTQIARFGMSSAPPTPTSLPSSTTSPGGRPACWES